MKGYYKNKTAYFSSMTEVCYSPEGSDKTYSKNDFINLASEYIQENNLKDQYRVSDLAEIIFDLCSWEHPETVIDTLDEVLT